MKKMLKKISLFSLGVLALIGLVACNSKNSSKKTTSTTKIIPTSTKKTTTQTTTVKRTTTKATTTQTPVETFMIDGYNEVDDVIVKVYTVLGDQKTEITDFTKGYEKDTELYFKIINNSTVSVEVGVGFGYSNSKEIVVGAGKEGEITDLTLIDDMYFYVDEVEQCTVTINNSFENLGVTVYYVDDDMQDVVVKSGDKVDKNTILYTTLANDDNKPYICYIYNGYSVLGSGMVPAGPNALGEINGFEIKYSISFETMEYSECTINYDEVEGIDVIVQDAFGEDPATYGNGDKAFTYCELDIKIVNNSNNRAIVRVYESAGGGPMYNLYVGETINHGKIFIRHDLNIYIDLYVEYDVFITIPEELSNKATCTVLGDYQMNGDVALSNGSKAARDTKITISATNSETEEIVRISVLNGSKIECDCVLTSEFSLEPFYLGGDLVIKVYIPEDPDVYYTFTIENDCEDITEIGGYVYEGFRLVGNSTSYEDSYEMDLSEAYLEGTVFTVYVKNKTSDKYILYELYINDSIKSRVSIRPNDFSSSDFTELTGNVKIRVRIDED